MVYKNTEFREKMQKRTKDFSLNLIEVLSRFPKTIPNEILIKQTIRSGTSIGANYREACEAESGKDFVHKIRICKKESKETLYWLELLIEINPNFTNELTELLREAKEFVKIFSSISTKFNS
ncbi:MAG: hypothetical protein UT24_C0009G0115 [Candidatus Woesebacteria bacterium GW2011_GWB1_39_12]|uniref:Four helix bundle protein n=2 Tax=Candidatus Woeseibacteriota TaxID=1752722 RepID=A0A0G0M362_9BACT|nr:MAG: hypothetical protein UT23_C0002G0113 [Candidatus Woesebacteria bacterium GW2011_GWA1_39_12]KKR00798.1 MAG: hypothetical protein UT24_C0009G0115 [Candidatus Woesebacteria bacterium GW2011_GWB1_39_12]